ncbi:carbohydrate ABC transporter permease [Bogoriella caseilytica]|uniref:Carbohydrate ABC transporter membrane protein 1 (CUT1 family) n=1 Tax=Bogoriella caseilytica TaxID=56055 RepID=A0A3N2BF57_9MICO|nr:sugar ABC transporter permease [Bogoriella caseilytica]ROR73889.1 carbohydrate ABC transporter membrane protein 1 (CUT1 family) [Bogoriella caseilytica]
MTAQPQVLPGGAGSSPAPPPERRAGSSRTLVRLTPFLLLLLPVGLVALALGYPLWRQVVMSFQEFGLAQQFGQPPEFVWLSNYTAILSDGYFWTVTARSLVFTAACAAATMFVGVGLAVMMQRVTAAVRVLLQVVLVFAWATPVIAAVAIWKLMVDHRHGVVNAVLVTLGLEQFQGFHWLQESTGTFLLVAGTVIVWASTPLVALATFAALTQVDDSVVEAAQLDGAGLLRRLRYIVLPIIKPVLILLAILQVIWDLRVFAQIYSLQQGAGSSRATNLLGTYIYHTGIGGGNYGMASALAMVMLAILVVLTWRYVRLLGKQGDLT